MGVRIDSVVALDVLAKALDLTPRRIQQLVNAGIIPRNATGHYEFVPAISAYVHYLRRGSGAEGVPSEGLVAGRHKLTNARAEIEELKRAKMAGELVPRDQVESTWAALVGAFRSHMLALPARIAARVGMARNIVEAQQLLRKEIEDALIELSKVNVAIAPAEQDKPGTRGNLSDDVADGVPAAKSDDLAVGG